MKKMYASKDLPSQAELRVLFYYDNETGNLIWRKPTSNRTKTGSIAGCIGNHGYRIIRINNKLILAHRAIWCFHNGYYPEDQIDHINRNRIDNRISNLREVRQSCNSRNSCLRKDNESGVTGILKRGMKWWANISIDGITKNLGVHTEFEEAILHRLRAEQCLGWSLCRANSPAYQYAIENKLIHTGGVVWR